MKKLMSNEGFQRIAKRLKSQTNENKPVEKQATSDNEVWDLADLLREHLGDSEFIESLLKAMSTEEALENLNFIAQAWDIRYGRKNKRAQEEYEDVAGMVDRVSDPVWQAIVEAGVSSFKSIPDDQKQLAFDELSSDAEYIIDELFELMSGTIK
jgi:hypothetical protein